LNLNELQFKFYGDFESAVSALKNKNIEYKKDVDFIKEKMDKIEKHIKNNNQDKRSKRELVRYIGHKKALDKYYSQ